jgi:predicted ATPase
MAELHTITIKGFKSIASLEKLRLGPINVVIGPNGSGKSNFLEFFRFLKAMVAEQLQDYVAKRGLQNLLHFGPKVTEALTSELVFDGGEVRSYRVKLEPGEQGVLLPVSEEIINEAGDTNKLARSSEESGLVVVNVLDFDEEPKSAETVLCRTINSWMSCHLHDTTSFSKMRQPCQVDDNRQLRPDGSNLAAYLYLLKKKYPAAYGLIRNTVQRVAPFFDDFALAPSQFDGSRIKLEWKHRDQDQYFDAQGLSDVAP